MTSAMSWIVVGLMIAVLFYAIFSIYLKKPAGLYIAAAFHIVLGILSLPSIGLYVFGLAVLEIITGIIMMVTSRRSR
ncbi:hypothetical protein [Bacillus piscicola]|uniref:hypothetical protein n=1 Tax=Bacillus piscicola TaxID=1632684 RepID=UPI001F097443|nr:hypothetical protein [Bacillus piscicola]